MGSGTISLPSKNQWRDRDVPSLLLRVAAEGIRVALGEITPPQRCPGLSHTCLFLAHRDEPAPLCSVRAQLPPRVPAAQGLWPGWYLPPCWVPLEAGPGRSPLVSSGCVTLQYAGTFIFYALWISGEHSHVKFRMEPGEWRWPQLP